MIGKSKRFSSTEDSMFYDVLWITNTLGSKHGYTNLIQIILTISEKQLV